MAKQAETHLRAYVGTYTRGKSKGIYLLPIDPATGAMGPPRLVAEMANPSFLAVDDSARCLYAASEQKAGRVAAFAIDGKTGDLAPLNDQPSLGSHPCHVSVRPGGGLVLAANYSSGSVCVLPVEADGRLGKPSDLVQHKGSSVNPRRQKGPHAHSVTPDAAGRLAYVADLGLDKVMIYRIDAAKGKLLPNDPPHAAAAAGAGPRHLAFSPSGRRAYLINEMGNTLTAFECEPSGGLRETETVPTLPAGFTGRSTTADVHVAPSGRFVYGSNRGHDSIVVYAVDEATGRLTHTGHQHTGGRTPRNFAVDPSGRLLIAANQNGDNLVAFRLDPESGRPTPTGHVAEIPAPVCVRILPDG